MDTFSGIASNGTHAAPVSGLRFVSLPIDRLDSNDYNPNVMTVEEFDELVVEVRHLGRTPKPIVVRPTSASRWEIVDGEHSWRAARQVGLTMIACEIVEADDLEAMRQTFKRNQHGTHHPVRLGQMFRRMLAESGLSQRALAATISVSEGTIRNSVIYAQAFAMRNGYAAGPSSAPSIDTLSVRQVRAYVQLPPTIGNLWINCGADLAALMSMAPAQSSSSRDHEGDAVLQDCIIAYTSLEKTGLVSYLPRHTRTDFAGLMKTLRGWADWEGRYCNLGLTREVLRPYTENYFREIWTVRTPLLMDRVLNLVLDPTTRPPSIHLTPEELAAALRPPETAEARTGGDSADDGFARVRSAVLAKTGRLPKTRYSIHRELLRAEIEANAPDYIQLSELPLDLKAALWRASGWHEIDQAREPTILLDAAKREVAQRSRLDVRKWEAPEAAIQRHLMAYWERERLKRQCDELTEREMASSIARRLPIYDEDTDHDAIATVASTLMRLTKMELLALFAYTDRIESWRALQAALSGLRLP